MGCSGRVCVAMWAAIVVAAPLQAAEKSAAAERAERRLHFARRPRLGRRQVFRPSLHANAQHRSAGGVGHALQAVLRRQPGLLAEPNGLHDRPLSRTAQHPSTPGHAPTERPTRHARLARSDGTYGVSPAEARGLRYGALWQVAPGQRPRRADTGRLRNRRQPHGELERTGLGTSACPIFAQSRPG